MKNPVTFGHFVLLGSIASLVLAGFVVHRSFKFLTSEFPDVAVLRTRYPVVDYHGKKAPPTVRLVTGRPRGWVSVSDVSHVAIGAIVVSEDWAFYQHHGYDPAQIKEAVKDSLEAGELTRGASTITQQVVKNVFLDREKHLWRKLKELYLATRLEDTLHKGRILEIYLNVAEWGEGIFGIGAASDFYFHKPPSALTAKEGAFLAMLLPSPKRYSQSYRAHQLTDYARSTISDILDKMTQAHYLSDAEHADARATPLTFERAGTAVPEGEAAAAASPSPAPSAGPGPEGDEEATPDPLDLPSLPDAPPPERSAGGTHL